MAELEISLKEERAASEAQSKVLPSDDSITKDTVP